MNREQGIAVFFIIVSFCFGSLAGYSIGRGQEDMDLRKRAERLSRSLNEAEARTKAALSGIVKAERTVDGLQQLRAQDKQTIDGLRADNSRTSENNTRLAEQNRRISEELRAVRSGIESAEGTVGRIETGLDRSSIELGTIESILGRIQARSREENSQP